MLPKDTEGYIVITQLRDLSHEDAEKEVMNYLKNAGKRRVYVSEIVEKLSLDIELVADILHKWRDQMCKDLCEEDGFSDYTSYTCPVVDCIYSNYLVR